MITKTFDRPQRSAIDAGRTRPRSLRPPFRLKGLPRLVLLLVWFAAPVMMLFLLLARNGATVAGTPASFPSPFAAYYTLMPGQPAQTIEGAACESGSPREPRQVCSVFPQDDLFHLISFSESHGAVRETSFFSEKLQLGHLLNQWGEPHFIRRSAGGRSFTLEWHAPLFSASATLVANGRDGYVRLVTVKATAGIY